MKKHWLLSVCGLVVFVVLTTICSAAPFEAKNTYADGQFSDVDTAQWYYSDVRAAYELGFMNGVASDSFLPEGTVTVAEAITVAARVHALYQNTSLEAANAAPWYAPYVSYAEENGILASGRFDDYERPIKRSEMAELFYACVPDSYLTAINTVDSIPDVAQSLKAYPSILALYRAGVIMGNDAYGTFYPERELSRAEAAAIIHRVARPEKRLTKTLQKRDAPTPALYYIDDTGVCDPTAYGMYGWDLDARGNKAGSVPNALAVLDVSNRESTAMRRTFAAQTDGTLVMETNLSLVSADNGFYMLLGNEQTNAMCFVTKDGHFFAKVGDTLTDTGLSIAKQMTVKTVTDMSAKTNTLIADGRLIGVYDFCDAECDRVDRLSFTSDKENLVYASVSKTKLYSGYALNEIFMASAERTELPYNWSVSDGLHGEVVKVDSNSYDAYSGALSTDGAEGTVQSAFSPIGRKVVYEMKFLVGDGSPALSTALTENGNEIVRIYTDNGAFYAQDGTLLRHFDPDVWQTLRLEANTDTGVVTYSVNHKKLYTGAFEAASFDGIRISLSAPSKATVYIDDLFVMQSFDEQPDYVPEPKKVESKDMHIGIEVCDIWRNGFQFGWDYTSAFEELHPYLGYYDEGSTEVADWEIKWLSEHGIDFKLVCWYSGTSTEPVKTPRNSYGLSAQLNAKYTDCMKYALLWENTYNLPKNSEQFRNNIVAYWKEYYLYDTDRYYSIDNKALIAIYNADKLTEIFGSTEAAAAELAYLRTICKELGYDDAILLACNGASETLAAMGFDGRYAYNWGQNAFDPAYQKQSLLSQAETASANGITAVPTVGVGFCNMYLGQGNNRTALITSEDYTSLLSWVRDDLLGARDGEAWENRMIILSNWNEFGEGHYILPTDGIGFSYLDAIRSVFVGTDAHEDMRPNDLTRFTALYDQNKKRIRRQERETETVDVESLTPVLTFDFTKPDTEKIFRDGHGNEYVEYSDTALRGKSKGGDFAILTNRTLQIDALQTTYMRVGYTVTAVTQTETGQLYFLTENSKAWDETKNLTFPVIADGEYHECLIDLSACAAWKGTVTDLRLDPIARGDCTYEIRLVELLSDPTTKYEIYVNAMSEPIETVSRPQYENGELYAAIDPYADNFYTRLGIYTDWNANTQTLTLYGAEDRYIAFTVGSRVAQTADGAVSLHAAITCYDGIPTVCIEAMAKALSLPMEIENGTYRLYHHDLEGSASASDMDMLFDFELPGYPDGFSFSGAELVEHQNGIATFCSKTNGKRHDPVLVSDNLNFPALKYEKITVRMAYETSGGVGSTADGIVSTLFFAYPNDGFSDKNSLSVKTEGISSGGAYVDIVFDMTQNENWLSTIGRIRFDPFEAEGTFKIDFVRIELTNPEMIPHTPAMPTEAVLTAGEDTPKGLRLSVDNGTLSAEPDPEDENQKVYRVQTKAASKQWTYFNIGMQFEAGARYRVSYRLYPLKDFAGNGYKQNAIGGNFIFGTDGATVSNHVNGSVKFNDTDSWKEVEFEYVIPEDYIPSAKDCFQFWSNPANGCGVSYLVADISITKES